MPNHTKKDNLGLVFIVDDERLARHHMALILTSAGYATRDFSSGEALLATVPSTEPACVLLDVTLPGGISGPAIQRRLSDLGWLIEVIFVTCHATVPMAVTAMKSGALDVLAKPVSPEVLLPAVENALARSRQRQAHDQEQQDGKRLAGKLTPREKEVLSWIVAGRLNKEAAYALGITERTVKAHRASIMDKLGFVSVAELTRFADKVGIIPARDSRSFPSGAD